MVPLKMVSGPSSPNGHGNHLTERQCPDAAVLVAWTWGHRVVNMVSHTSHYASDGLGVVV